MEKCGVVCSVAKWRVEKWILEKVRQTQWVSALQLESEGFRSKPY